MTTQRLTWETSRFAGFNGRAANLQLFTIGYRTVRTDPAWTLRCALPGYDSKTWKDDDPEALYAKAERLLDRWLTQVGNATPAATT